MEYMDVKIAAEKWGISERRVRALCLEGKIEGVRRCGSWNWNIPVSSSKPVDGRKTRFLKNRDLRTGSQDYKEVDAKRKKQKCSLTADQRKNLVLGILEYDGKSYTPEQIEDVIRLNKQEFDLKSHLEILNINSVFSEMNFDVSETAIKNINSKLMFNILIDGGAFRTGKLQAELDAALLQYSNSWNIIHPVARAAFLFSEIMRIQPFEQGNTATAFYFLEAELLKNGFPGVVFSGVGATELKAALASATIRGNTKNLIDMIKEAIIKS